MKLVELKLKNFRSYKEETSITFNDLTAIIGKNDVGKSTILEALEIFFNGEVRGNLISFDNSDINVFASECIAEITCIFADLPESLSVDAGGLTSLQQELLLNEDGYFEVKKSYDVSGAKPKITTSIICEHPQNDELKDLLLLTNAAVKSRAMDLSIDKSTYNASINAEIRNAIRKQIGSITLEHREIEISKDFDKKLYEAIFSYLPMFALFQSDRSSKDGDKEVTDPMKIAIKQALLEAEKELNDVKQKVMENAMNIADRTLIKLKEMAPEIAETLYPEFSAEPKYDSVFKLSIASDNGIPMNKRGSGVRRLLLLNFFRAEAERRLSEENHASVIYAIEEPETSQHPDFQIMLIDSFYKLAMSENTQIIITTHTPNLAGMVSVEDLRFVDDERKDNRIKYGDESVYRDICETLGLLPNPIGNDIKAVLLVEGPGDVIFVKHIAEKLYENGVLPDTFESASFAIVPIGGCGTLKYWINQKIIEQFDIPWCILLDSDIGSAENTGNMKKIDKLRQNGVKAYATRKREPENYINPACVREPVLFSDTDDAKKIIATATNMKDTNVLIKIWPKMTFEQIREAEKYIDEDGKEHYEFEEMFKDFFELTA